jgi:hypothetical protein
MWKKQLVLAGGMLLAPSQLTEPHCDRQGGFNSFVGRGFISHFDL